MSHIAKPFRTLDRVMDPGSRVLFLSLVGPPDGVSTARLVGALAQGLSRRGHRVAVLTTTPHYNRDVEAEKAQPITWTAAGLVGRSRIGGVDVVHVRMPRKGRNVLFRIGAWLWFHLVSTAVAWFALPKSDVVIAPSPPLTIGVSAWLVCKWWGASFVYNVQEIYPDVAVQLGVLRNRAMIAAFAWLERFVYRRADVVTVISAGMEANLRAKGVPGVKLLRIPNHVDIVDMSSIARPNPFAVKHGLMGSFVVTYAGNIGKPQGLETVVRAAEALQSDSDVRFLIVGDGAEKPHIERLVEHKRLTNVIVLPYQPYSSVPEIYGATSVALVLQAPGTGHTALPSKAVQIVGAGLPIVAVADAQSDLADFVVSTGSGLVVAPGRGEDLAAQIQAMKADYGAWQARALSARGTAIDAYSYDHVVGAYSRLIERLDPRAPA